MTERATYGQVNYLKKILEAVAHKNFCKPDEAAKILRVPLPINTLPKDQAAKYIERGLVHLSGRPATSPFRGYSVSEYWKSVKGR